MRDYHALVRALVIPSAEGSASEAPRLGDPYAYRALVRLQHRQPLAQVFEALRSRVGEARFEALFEDFRGSHPPTDPQPSRWVRPFADALGARDDLDEPTRELADYLATRTEQATAPDLAPDDLGSAGELRAYQHDPRAVVRGQDGGPCTILIFRDGRGEVRAPDMDLGAIAAWGLSRGQTTRDALAARGVDEATLRRGEDALARLRAAPAGARSPLGSADR